jgi:excisionase family DNA binding protein
MQGEPRVTEPNEFLTPTEAAARLRVSKMTVYRLIHGGHLPAIQVGKAFRIRERDLAAFLEAATVPRSVASQEPQPSS